MQSLQDDWPYGKGLLRKEWLEMQDLWETTPKKACHMKASEQRNGWDIDQKEECESCLRGKITKRPFESSMSKASKKLELHADLVGPMEPSRQGLKYILTLVDDLSRYTVVYGLKSKSETLEKFKVFKALVENQLDEKIKKLRTDWGGEFVNQEMKKLLEESGIEHQVSCAYTPQQNGRVERSRTLVECARSMFQSANLSTGFWLDAVEAAAYVKNRSVHSTIRRRHSKYGLERHLSFRICECLDAQHMYRSREFHEDYSQEFGADYCETCPGHPSDHVDDLLLIWRSAEDIITVKEKLKSNFEMKDLGQVKRLLGIDIERDRKQRTITSSQSRHIKEMLDKFNMTNAKPAPTAIEVSEVLANQ